jgi:hypothetical protein
MGEGAQKPTDPKQTPNACERFPGRQEPWDNLRLREGKNPDRRLRSRSTSLVVKEGCGSAQTAGRLA